VKLTGEAPNGIFSNALLWISFLLFAVVVVGYTYLHLGIYPKAEFRNWIDRSILDSPSPVKTFLDHPSRSFAFIYMRTAGDVCGMNWGCLNFVNGAIPLVGSAVFIILLVKKFSKSFLIPCLVATLYLVSYPVLSGWTWQPTALDKFASFFGLALLFIVYRIFTTEITGTKSLVFYNLLLGLIIFSGMGSKEIFWPILASIAFIAGGALLDDLKNWKKIRFFILPAFVVMLSAGRLFYLILVEGYLMTDHNTSGDPLRNLSQTARMFFNHPLHVNIPEPIGWVAIMGSIIGGLVIIFATKLSWTSKGMIAALLFSLLVGIGLTSVTSGNAPFYYIALIGVFLILLAICIVKLESRPWIPNLFAILLIAGILKCGHYSFNFLIEDNELSDSFATSMTEVLASDCDYKTLPVLVDTGFNNAGVYINGTWCSHKRVLENNTELHCGPKNSRPIAFKRAVNKNYTFPERYLYLDRDFKIAKLACE
jgi:hypothetical protein